MDGVLPFMTPNLKPYGKSIWQATLKMLDGEELSPTDYVLLESFSQTADQLKTLNEQLNANPVIFIDGMVKANPLQWNAQSLIKTLALLSDKLGLNRVMRKKEGLDAVPQELLKFLRGEPDESQVST
jgi:phage terminase small subunit